MSFEEYGLSPELLNGLADVRITEPTPLQNEVLPAALQGKHLLVKTEAGDEGTFLIPALQKIAGNGEVAGTQALILTPSIEKAKKIDELVWAMGYHAQISSALLSMKGNKEEQERAVLDGAPVIVANPGRLIEILEKNDFRLRDLKIIVIDEAHEMQNFNLVSRVKDILKYVEGNPQTLILSGSRNDATSKLADAALENPELFGFNGESSSGDETAESVDEVDLEEAKKKLEEAEVDVVLNPAEEQEEQQPEATPKEISSADEVNLEQAERKLKEASVKVVLKKNLVQHSDSGNSKEEEIEPVMANSLLQGEGEFPSTVAKELEQGYMNVPPRMKISTLMAHLEESKAKKVMVFAASKRTTDRLFRIIRKKNWGVVSISEGIDENTYNERFARFTSGEMRILLVGGIKAEDVEIEQVEEVINYDVPNETDEYRYRAELVGNGKAARIISLVSKMDRDDIKRISEEVGYPPSKLELPKELEDRKKGKAKNNRSAKKNGKAKVRSKNKKQDRKRVQKKKLELPRPRYDGLSGGREGKTEETDGLFGWVKKLFN